MRFFVDSVTSWNSPHEPWGFSVRLKSSYSTNYRPSPSFDYQDPNGVLKWFLGEGRRITGDYYGFSGWLKLQKMKVKMGGLNRNSQNSGIKLNQPIKLNNSCRFLEASKSRVMGGRRRRGGKRRTEAANHHRLPITSWTSHNGAVKSLDHSATVKVLHRPSSALSFFLSFSLSFFLSFFLLRRTYE